MPRKLLMTGTPIQNNLSELWALMHFCMPSIFGTLEQFLYNFKEAGDPSCKLIICGFFYVLCFIFKMNTALVFNLPNGKLKLTKLLA